MEFLEKTKVIRDLFDSWLQDPKMIEFYQGDEIEVQKDFIHMIQNIIKSNFVIYTPEEFDKKLSDYNRSMEGYY
jgi:hypothetical protein